MTAIGIKVKRYGMSVQEEQKNYPVVQFSHSVMSNSVTPWTTAGVGLPVHHQLLELTQTHVH